MALEASVRLIYIIWVNWRCTCGCISRPIFKLNASLLDISQDLRKNCRPPQVWFILGSNFQTPEGTTFICTNNSTQVQYKHHGTTQPSYRLGRRRVLSPRDERTLVRNVQIHPRTTAKDLVKMLEETGTKVSISTVKRVLYRHNCHALALVFCVCLIILVRPGCDMGDLCGVFCLGFFCRLWDCG